MEKRVQISRNQKVGEDDFVKLGTFPQGSLDHVVVDGVEPLKAFTGFVVVKSGPARVTVGAGRLFDTGRVFFNADPGGTVLDFTLQLPTVGKRIAAILVSGQDGLEVIESREFLVSEEPIFTEVRQAAVEVHRRANIEPLFGAENAAPVRPSVAAQYVVVAWVTLGPSGVEEPIVANDAARLRSVRETWNRTDALGRTVDALSPKLAGIEQDIARLSAEAGDSVTRDAVLRVMQDVADLKDIANLPDTYVDYGSDIFLDEEESKTAAPGYAAKIQDGLRFPNAASSTMELALLNDLAPGISKSARGLILPSSQETRYRVVTKAGEIALNTVAFNSNLSILRTEMARSRNRFGAEFEVSSSSSFWKTASAPNAQGILQKDGEIFQVFPTNRYAEDGTRITRVRKMWVDYYDGAYWTFNASEDSLSGFQYAQTYLNQSDRWIGGITIHPTRLDASGPVTVLVFEATGEGGPDERRIIGEATVQPGELRIDQANRVGLAEPVFFQQGKRYGHILSSPGNHWFAVGDPSQAPGGGLFYRAPGGYWQHDPSKHLVFDLWVLEFDRARTTVDLKPIQLLGGVAAIDVLAEMVTPPGAKAFFEIQIGATWYPVTADLVASPLAALQALVPLRLVFQGGVLAQSGIRLNGSRLIASRPALAMRHQSVTRTLPSATTKIRTQTMVENFDAAKHVVTPKIVVGGSEVSASLVTNRELGPDVIERTAHFNLGTATATFDQLTTASSTEIGDLPIVSRAGYVAIP